MRYLVRRLLLALFTLWVLSVLVFLLLRFLPGDVADLMVAQEMYASDVGALRAMLGLDRPIYEQYFSWFGGVLRGDWGDSLWTKRAVMQEFLPRFPVTLELGVISLLLSVIIGIPLGLFSAVRQDSPMDYTLRILSIAALAIPGFWLATLVILLPSLWFRWMPPTGNISFFDDPLGNLALFALPSLVLSFRFIGVIARMTRTTMLEVLRQDYIRTAWSKGLRERLVLTRHAMKNALIPVVTILGLQVSFLIGGSVVIESIFGLPGLGQFLLDAANKRDYPVVQGLIMAFGGVVVISNLAVDLAYSYLDPRIRYA